MNNKIDLSIIMPGIRRYRWWDVYTQLHVACKKYTWELIIVTPHSLPEEFEEVDNVIHIVDHGTPSRGLQRGTTYASGEYITWVTDDSIPMHDSIDMALEGLSKAYDQIDNNAIVGMRYDEGPSYAMDRSHDLRYWKAHTHEALQLDGVNELFLAPTIMLMKTSYYRDLGGIDCRFEHINFNLIDLVFRIQMDESTVYLSGTTVLKVNSVPERTSENSAVLSSADSDHDLFMSIYGSMETAEKRDIRIPYDNWKESPEVWQKRKDMPNELG